MDIKINYVEKGSGVPLILLHGNGENLEYFNHQIDFFSKYYRVIAIDTRGHGKSERGTKPFTIKQFAEDLKDFLDEMGIKKAILLGFSDGGNIALTFALKYGDYVEKLILNGANLYPKGVKLTVQLPIYLGYALCSIISLFSKKAVNNKELLGLMVKEPNISKEELNSINIRTLVIVGSNDMIKESHSRKISDNIKNSVFTIIKGDHFIANKEYEEFNKKVFEFLK
ncbi:MAG: alpha/beta hydrolase [Clostridiales bacterium]|nr:alpha/beta hydrolase [Clostridiales bacterium]